MEPAPAISARREIVDALSALRRRPFATLLLVAVFVSIVTTSISVNATRVAAGAQLSTLALAMVSIYIQIAVVLAAVGDGDVTAADPWVKAAIRNRCFWRYLGATLIQALLVLLGALLLLVGGVVVGGIVALAQSGVVLERLGPIEAVRRSSELTRPARRPVAIVFGLLVLLPPLVLAVLQALPDVRLGAAAQIAESVLGTALSLTAAIALARLFVKLGGEPSV